MLGIPAAGPGGQEPVFLVTMQVLCGFPIMSQEPFSQLSFYIGHAKLFRGTCEYGKISGRHSYDGDYRLWIKKRVTALLGRYELQIAK